METVILNNGVKMPLVGFGVFQITDLEQCEKCVLEALDTGYRLIDTAQAYYNEEAVGRALEKSGVPREEIFLTTKVWVTEFGYEKARKSVLESMRKLKVDYLDLVLIHHSVCFIDSLSLRSGDKFFKIFRIAAGERKYPSGTSSSKTCDNVQPPSLLRDSEICAVMHTPFEIIPQLSKRGEDGVKRPAAVMR